MTFQQQQQKISSSIVSEEIVSGLDFIINHFDHTILYFPRTIMTKKLKGQIVVYAKEEALQYFKQSEFQNCRINAYRYSSFNSIEQQWTPDLLFIDIDKSDFKSDISCKLALSNTLKNIKEKLNGFPTVLFTGGGYHIYQPVYCPTALENIIEFKEFDRPSEQFLRFAKDYLSHNRADKNNNPSFKSCLLRIPGSINSKNMQQVTIIQKWNGFRPSVTKDLLLEFRRYLIQKKIEAENIRQKMLLKLKNQNNNNNRNYYYYYEWIETKVLQTSLSDHRKLIVGLVLVPYLIVIKKLSYDQSYKIINEWLQKCDSVQKLDFDPKYLINNCIKTSMKKLIPPISRYKLETNYRNLYLLLLDHQNNTNNNTNKVNNNNNNNNNNVKEEKVK